MLGYVPGGGAMKFSLLILTLCSLWLLSCTGPSVVEEEDGSPPSNEPVYEDDESIPIQTWQWAYRGDKGPDEWATLNNEYAMCSTGQEQSPINLIWSKPKKPSPLKVNYQPGDVVISNTGYTFRMEFTPRSQIEFDGQEYLLEKAEIRTPSEHNLSGRQMPMEIQFYHRSPNGLRQAMISIFVVSGEPSSWFDEFWNISLQTGLFQTSETFRMNPDMLIPPRQTYYHYRGSLTHPPCLEGVDWFVFNTPLTLSTKQILSFKSIYNENNRPIRKTNGRKVTNY